jgi:hypothetical protein
MINSTCNKLKSETKNVIYLFQLLKLSSEKNKQSYAIVIISNIHDI